MKKQIKFKTKLRKGDTAIVISGKEKGKKGKVLHIDLSKGRVVLEGIKQRSKFVRPTNEAPKGGLINIETPIALSNVMFYDEKLKRGVRLGFDLDKDSKKAKKNRVTRIGNQK